MQRIALAIATAALTLLLASCSSQDEKISNSVPQTAVPKPVPKHLPSLDPGRVHIINSKYTHSLDTNGQYDYSDANEDYNQQLADFINSGQHKIVKMVMDYEDGYPLAGAIFYVDPRSRMYSESENVLQTFNRVFMHQQIQQQESQPPAWVPTGD
jgi:major membrane immunogen (membrane-anchored lipoprotein)